MNQSELAKERYLELVKKATPNSKILKNCVKAFIIGGLICCLGQFIHAVLERFGLSKTEVSSYTSIILVFLGAFFTGIGWYDKLGNFAGAGSIVPITGFANSVTAPAVEFKKEGFILGVGAKMFIVAGPVIVYGTLASVLVGLFYFFTR
ncbi:MAG: stage V sporulation protein AC [Clostridiales bacterium]|jgi:stage V sporulation protein AC|nr:stage V sporulation protein AC [Clostridiales bacterium]